MFAGRMGACSAWRIRRPLCGPPHDVLWPAADVQAHGPCSQQHQIHYGEGDALALKDEDLVDGPVSAKRPSPAQRHFEKVHRPRLTALKRQLHAVHCGIVRVPTAEGDARRKLRHECQRLNPELPHGMTGGIATGNHCPGTPERSSSSRSRSPRRRPNATASTSPAQSRGPRAA